jgi:cytochrome c-type biogenesis protein CcmF
MSSSFLGEHTLAGQAGHLLTLISFVAAILSGLAYLLHAQSGDAGWRRVGRLAFITHALAVLGIIVTLFVMLFNHWFEFDYVWKHSNRAMPLRYIASCFWEGQEGSFLLFTFWNMVLGLLLIRKGGEWEGPVLAIVALVQVFLASMLLGVYVFDVRVGSSPFLLVRQLPENLAAPWTQWNDYLTRIPQFQDGRGLNPLLQNYWMVIHPPTVLFGFASTLVPFAFAAAGLWKRRYTEWIAPALPWTFFGIMVLGTGVLMGGAWAYEALSFGGFWAWDPVENGSLIPWLTLVAAGHLMLINRRKPNSVFATLLLSLGTFLIVLYSTFLTRSGVLGDTSVHSFTGEGMLPGLLLFLVTLVAVATALLNTQRDWRIYAGILPALLLVVAAITQAWVAAIVLFLVFVAVMTVVAYRTGPFHTADEEHLWSREFWLFIGALLLLLSAVQITLTTSIPVFNLLVEPFNPDFKRAPPVNAIAHYNKWQVPFAFLVSMLMAVGQFLRYKQTEPKRFFRELVLSLVLALAMSVGCVLWLKFTWAEGTLVALLFSSVFAAIANTAYAIQVLPKAASKWGPSVAHVGFALVLLGALISTGRQRTISHYVKGPSLASMSEDFSDGKDMLLFKYDTVPLGDHYVTYRGSRKEDVNLYFDMDYLRAEPRSWQKGDTVRVRSTLWVAKNDHVAGSIFLLDQPDHWTPLDSAPRRVFWHAPLWSSTKPADKEFSLAPLVQLNPRFGNVAEPSTRHWVHKDLYTHIRYAKLDPADSTDFMPPRLVERSIGDTVITSTCVIVVDSVRAVRDSVIARRLGPEYTAFVAKVKVRDLYDDSRWFEARPVIVYRFDQPVGSKGFDVDPLKVRIDLASIKGDTVGLNIYEREFVVLQAIEFPGINILWAGCILMALGTGLAVWQRARTLRT